MIVGTGVDIVETGRIEEAHDTLLDPVRRRAYDLSTFPDEVTSSLPTLDLASRIGQRLAVFRRD